MSMAPEKNPVRKKPARPSHRLGAKAIQGTQQQKSNPVKMTSLALPNRTESQPVIGIATSAPIAVVKSRVPKTLLDTPKWSLSSGRREVRLEYKKPFAKK